jgi:RND family efflux transporter MFP subunit
MNDAPSHDRWRKPVADRVNEIDPKYLPEDRREGRPRWGARLLGFGVLLVLGAALAAGGWRHYQQRRDAIAVSEQRRNFVPNVRVATIASANAIANARLPATTSAFAAANIFARASGYIEKRHVDIGDRVKKGQLLVEITAPELDHQIAQAEATLAQLQAAQQQAQANLDLAQVTLNRNDPLVRKGWFTQQQGVSDVQTLKAQQAALGVAQGNVTAQQAQLQVLRQQKVYQRVVAPFDGVITKRNIDIGSLVQADANSGTFMFSMTQSNVIRAQVFVPQDLALGVSPGIDAVLHVPEIPDRAFPGTVTRIANALAPGTRTLLTEVDIQNPDGTITPGTQCTIELRIPRKTPGLLVPAAAIILNAGALQVAVVRDGIVHIQKILVVRDLGTEVETAGGVAQGDQVILNPPIGLADGARVSIRSEPVGEPR